MYQIPTGRPLGDDYSVVQLIIGVVVMVLCVVGMVLYLRWKLPREGERLDQGPDSEDSGEDGSQGTGD